MLKRLLTAVLILAIFMVFTGTAFSGTNNIPSDDHNRDHADFVKKSTGTSSRLKAVPPKANRPGGFIVDFSSSVPANRVPPRSVSSTDTTICAQVDYYNHEAGTCDALYGLRSNAANPRVAMRFDGPQLPNTQIKVNGVWPFIYWTNEGGVSDGIVKVTAEVWTDLGGLPNTKVYSETFALPIITYPSGSNYYFLGFTNPPLMSGAYHIAIMADSTGPSTDTLIVSSDWGDRGVSGGCPAGTFTPTFRSSRYNAGGAAWYPQAAINGFTANFDMFADFCQVYSSCYTAETPSNLNFQVVGVPDNVDFPGETLQGVGQQFFSAGHDTVKSVTLYHYDFGVQEYPLAGTNAVQVDIWGDSAGQPAVSAGALATVIVPGGVASLFPNTGDAGAGFNIVNVPVPSMPVVIGPWHVTAKMTSTNPADGLLEFLINSNTSDPGRVGGSVSFTPPAPLWRRTGISGPWTGLGLGERAFFFDVGLCKDEFYACQDEQTFLFGTTRFLYMDSCGSAGSVGSRNGVAQLIQGGISGVNRVDKIRFQIADEFVIDGAPDVPNSVRVSLFANNAGAVGATLYSTVLTNAQLTMYPGWTELVIPGGMQIAAPSFFVGMEPIFHLDANNEWLYMARERVGDQPAITSLVNGGMYVKLCADNLWHQNIAIGGANDNAIFEVDFCSTLPSEWTCNTPDDYPTAGHDYGRTGHANVALNDAYCRLTFKWKYEDPGIGTATAILGSAAPITFDTFVVCNFGTKYQILDLNNGAVVKTITGSGAPNHITPSGALSCTPTIAKITISGTPTNVLFLGGGTTQFVDAFNMDVAGFPLIWAVNIASNTAFANFVTLNIGGTDMLYLTAGAKLFELVAATGAAGSWGPLSFPASLFRGIATDGTNLFVSQSSGVSILGDIYSINATTGAINWQLSTSGGLKGDGTVYTAGTYPGESFASGIAYNGGELYTVSGQAGGLAAIFPADGVFYRLNSANGAVKSAVASIYVNNPQLQDATPIIDASHVIIAGASPWATPPLGGTVLFYNRFTGLLSGAANPGNHAGQNGVRGDGFLTCEPGAPDQLFVGSSFGYLSDFNADDFQETFNRRVDILGPANTDGLSDRMAGVAIAPTGEVLAAARAGGLYCLTNQSPRPRLEILNYTPQAPTYGPLTSVLLHFPQVFTNTGCTPLIGTVYAFDASNGSSPGAPRGYNPPKSLSSASSIADRLTTASLSGLKKASPQAGVSETESATSTSRHLLNRASTASVPTFINGAGTYPFNLNPGDTSDVVFDVKQNLIKRGPNVFWADFQSNDPDFFLNNTSEEPECVMTIVGGCLLDTTTLHFGSGGANWALISNTGRVADGNWTAAAGSWFVDGDNKANMYQGTYIYGVSYARIALNSQDWFGDGKGWASLQADPNICDVDCKPALSASVSLGSITSNGLVYTPLTGNLICRSFLDSVQNFGPPSFASWNWENYTAGFDNDSTMGLYVTSRVVGFLSAPAPYTLLNNVVVDFLKISQRDQTRSLPNWRMGAVVDYDLGNDTGNYDASSSLAWDYPHAITTGAWGWIKLPFGGCGVSALAPLRTEQGLNEDQALFLQTAAVHGNGYLDSAYYHLNKVGAVPSSSPTGSDAAFSVGFIAHDFVPGPDTLAFALAHFALPGITNNSNVANYQPLAHLLNKWTGAERGDVNNDGVVNLADIVYLAKYLNGGAGTPGPIPFMTCGDANGDGLINAADVTYLINYYFYYGPCPVSKLVSY